MIYLCMCFLSCINVINCFLGDNECFFCGNVGRQLSCVAKICSDCRLLLLQPVM